MIQERLAVLTDRFTARVLGMLVLVMTLLIDVSSVVLSRPETRQQPRFFLVVMVPSLPLLGLGIYLLRRANSLADSREDDR
jgi:lipopolysaccharide export LptBFGC system permease protein LptF